MGFILPAPYSPREQVRILMSKKENIEAEIDAHVSVLKANNCTMQSPLVDGEGFPRDDIDIYQVRGARVQIIRLRNDLKAISDDIAKALEAVYDPSNAAAESSIPAEVEPPAEEESNPKPFAKVDGVAPGSPAAEAGLQREDLVIKFGHLTSASFTSSSLQMLAELVGVSENREIPIKVLRESDQISHLKLTPRKGWGGRGMLGCHIVPFTP